MTEKHTVITFLYNGKIAIWRYKRKGGYKFRWYSIHNHSSLVLDWFNQVLKHGKLTASVGGNIWEL